MSYIPDTRRTYSKLYGKTKENSYYEGYLNDTDAEYVAGFDWVTDLVLRNFFHEGNAEDVYDILVDNVANISENEELITYLENLSSDERKNIVKAIKFLVLDHIEMDRDELITSMIDSMDDDELAKLKEAYNNGRRNSVLKQSHSLGITDENGIYTDEEYKIDD